MLLVLVIAALLAWRVNRARQQKGAVLAVKRHGGWVHYDYEFVNGNPAKGRSPWAPRWIRRILGDEYFQNVEQVSLVYDDSTGKRFDNSNVEAADALLKRLSKLPGLKELLLHRTQATDEGLKHIGKMTDLEKLWIWSTVSVTDAGVAHLAGLKNTARGLEQLKELPNLKQLWLNGTGIRSNDVQGLLDTVPNLKISGLR